MLRPWPLRPRPKHALADPWYRGRFALGAASLALLGVVVVLVVLVAGGRGDRPASTSVPLPVVDCIEVANPSLLITIAAEDASAVALDDGWFVAKADGATWYTTADPTRDAAGELLPMNDRAREDSDSGREVDPESPLYRGHTDDERAAEAARACASE